MSEAVLRSYYQAYNSLDTERLCEILSPDVELVSPLGTERGHQAYLATFHYMTGMFVDVMTPETITVSGNTVTVAIHDSLTAKADVADFMGHAVKAGEELILRVKGEYTLVDGRIARAAITPIP